MEVGTVGRLLALVGAGLLFLGLLFVFPGRIPLLGGLPGDILFRRDGLTVYVPLATMLLLSSVLTVVLNVLSRLFR